MVASSGNESFQLVRPCMKPNSTKGLIRQIFARGELNLLLSGYWIGKFTIQSAFAGASYGSGLQKSLRL